MKNQIKNGPLMDFSYVNVYRVFWDRLIWMFIGRTDARPIRTDADLSAMFVAKTFRSRKSWRRTSKPNTPAAISDTAVLLRRRRLLLLLLENSSIFDSSSSHILSYMFQSLWWNTLHSPSLTLFRSLSFSLFRSLSTPLSLSLFSFLTDRPQLARLSINKTVSLTHTHTHTLNDFFFLFFFRLLSAPISYLLLLYI